jgi:hypothetical protein
MYYWLKAKNVSYRDTNWSAAAESQVFSGCNDDDEWFTLDLPIIMHDHADGTEEDTGPASQQLGVATENSETVSGFVGAVPTVDVNAAIQAAVARAIGTTAQPLPSVAAPTPPAEGLLRVEGHGDALSEFESGYYSSAFPEIFLSGSAELNAERDIKLTEREWLEHLMWTGDGRVARHKVFCFVAWSMLQRHQCLAQGSVYVSSHFANNPMPISELRDQIGRGDRSIPTSIFYWGASMRGSDAYMQGLKREIDALINHEIHAHRRLPSFFLTFSCAEFYWKVLLDLLAEFMVKVEPGLNGVKPDLHTNASLRFQKLQEYAHVVTLFFEQRAMSFIADVLKPALDLCNWYAVFEFAKSRGQIHVHLLAWREDGEPHHLMHKSPKPYATASELVQAFEDEPLFAPRHGDAALRSRLSDSEPAVREAAWVEADVWAVVRAGGEAASVAWQRTRECGRCLLGSHPGFCTPDHVDTYMSHAHVHGYHVWAALDAGTSQTTAH